MRMRMFDSVCASLTSLSLYVAVSLYVNVTADAGIGNWEGTVVQVYKGTRKMEIVNDGQEHIFSGLQE